MKSLFLAVSAVLVALATSQPHMPLAPQGPPSLAPQAPPAATESTAAAVVTESSAAPTLQTDTTAADVTTSAAAPDVTSATTDADVTTTAAAVETSAATESPSTTVTVPTTTAAPNYYPSVDEIIDSFKALAESEYFKSLNFDEQLLLLELTSGGEVGKIEEVMDSVGYERLFTFIYKIPLKYLDDLMQFILASLQRERLLNAMNSS